MGDTLISIVIMLFVLSLIAERISTLIKLHIKVTRQKGVDKEEESIRERKVIWISLLSGFLTALALKADLILILRTAFSKQNDSVNFDILLGWTIENFKEIISNPSDLIRTFFGIIFSAIFLSFGSKFWHDTIDILLEVKNAKRSITNLRQQYGVDINDGSNVLPAANPNPISLQDGTQNSIQKDNTGNYLPFSLNFSTIPANEPLQISISGDPNGTISGIGQKYIYTPSSPLKVVKITATFISNPNVSRVFFLINS